MVHTHCRLDSDVFSKQEKLNVNPSERENKGAMCYMFGLCRSPTKNVCISINPLAGVGAICTCVSTALQPVVGLVRFLFTFRVEPIRIYGSNSSL